MRSFIQRLTWAFCVWEVCVVLLYLAVFAAEPRHIWGKDDIIWFAMLGVCGLIVVWVVALLSRRRGKVGGAIVGLLCGLLPSALLLAYVFIAQPGFEGSAGMAGIAMLLAIPSGVGGAIAGVICSRRSAAVVASILG